MPTVYDVGMHNGDDSAYYLRKGYDVVAIEASPSFCADARVRFKNEIDAGRMRIINCAASSYTGEISFYKHKTMSGLSTVVRPEELDDWEEEVVACMPLSQMIDSNDDLAFIKIDIERADLWALESLDAAGLKPAQIQCEAHSPEILAKLLLMGYNRFKLVHGKSVHKKYLNHKIRTLDGEVVKYSFVGMSSGPFGDDLPGDWQSIDQIMYLWSGRYILYGKGWFDIHASIV
jgi:FkbM family methyltransferase